MLCGQKPQHTTPRFNTVFAPLPPSPRGVHSQSCSLRVSSESVLCCRSSRPCSRPVRTTVPEKSLPTHRTQHHCPTFHCLRTWPGHPRFPRSPIVALRHHRHANPGGLSETHRREGPCTGPHKHSSTRNPRHFAPPPPRPHLLPLAASNSNTTNTHPPQTRTNEC